MPVLEQSLKPFNTFQIEHSCAQLFHAKNKEELTQYCLALYRSDKPFMLLGGGSNIVLTEDFQGAVVRVESKGVLKSEDDNFYYLDVQAGENWHELVETSLLMSIQGLENLALIPGTVGASPIQNIGAYGVELKDVCDWVEYLDLTSGELIRLKAADCDFSYRESIFKKALKTKAVITAVGFKIRKVWQPVLTYGPLKAFDKETVTAKQVFDCICSLRNEKLPDPAVLGNAGSFFKNPVISKARFMRLKEEFNHAVGFTINDEQVKVAAGWLIDNLGLKGYTVGGASVHEDQALVLVNLGKATGSDVVQLAKNIINSVKHVYDITLEVEPRIIGANGEKELVND
ncbi:UDP-N-acetylmuramate dehydrogenase [Shewanella sp. UCD-KL12]|uniref:UDP-N-acetylmuramate dehydrogenase n=1 Tax=Shewanella sp. UCD-KL12 TaxID=1917163 RepID=UPI000970C4F2|nr:UDP-N-acetylmuramate dehydrogenase [Shewanella sp. UCD-KL12]